MTATTCRKCAVPMTMQRTKAPPGKRRHHGRGLCTSCYARELRAGSLDRWVPTERAVDSSDLIEDVEWMRDTGEHPEWWAPRLGYTTHQALARRLYRAGRRDLASRIEAAVRYAA